MNVQKLFDTYFENIRTISSLFFSNSRFALELFGDAFNSSSPHLYRESDCQLVCSFPSCYAYFVHRDSFIVEEVDSTPVDKEKRVLKFVCKNAGSAFDGDSAVFLSPTSDTRTLLEESDSFGLSLTEVPVIEDNDTRQCFLLKASVADGFPPRILFCCSSVIELLELDSSAAVYDHKAVQTTVAIACECWPSAAVPWMTRYHPWISDDVVNSVASSTVYFVPKPISQCCIVTKSHKHVLWMPEFIAAEDLLMEYLGVEIKIAYQLLLQLVVMHRLECCCVSRELLIKYALFWCLDDISATDDWNKKSVVTYYMYMFKMLHSFLSRRHFPHYFMPSVNILCSCDSSACDILWMETAVNDLTAVQLKAEVIQQTLACTSSDVTCSVSCHLKALFSYSVYMSYIQLFHCLHRGASVDHMVAQHHDVLNYMHSSSPVLVSTNSFLKPLIAWINSSLGTLYLAKACTETSGHCQTDYAEKAEHCMQEAIVENNTPSCILYYVHLLLHIKCYKEANSCMDMLLARTEFTHFNASPNQNLSENCTNDTVAFSDQLLAVWHHTSWHIDVMFSSLEFSMLFPQLQSSVLYAYCDKLGFNGSPVAVLKPEFWMQYIGSLCYMHGDVARALKLLADAERSLVNTMLPAVGVSNRAHIMYFNVLAGIFTQ